MAGAPMQALIATIVSILIATLFVHVAARMVIDRSSFLVALGVAVIGSLGASAVFFFLQGLLGVVIAVLVWAAIAALFYRTQWTKGAIIGVVAWILWAITTVAIGIVLRRLG